jgi:hypothetical protein
MWHEQLAKIHYRYLPAAVLLSHPSTNPRQIPTIDEGDAFQLPLDGPIEDLAELNVVGYAPKVVDIVV